MLKVKDENFPSGERGPGSAAQEMIEVNPQELKKMQNRENRKKLTGLLEKIEGCSVSTFATGGCCQPSWE